MGYGRDEVYICNVVKCRTPENRKPDPAEIVACKSYLDAQLSLVKPKVIVTLGATALEAVTGKQDGITRARGKWTLYKNVTLVMPTYHPAYLLRVPTAKRDVWKDMMEVLRFLGKSPPEKASS
jgi:DNA polymerase